MNSLPGEVTADFVFKGSGNTSLVELVMLNKEVEWREILSFMNPV